MSQLSDELCARLLDLSRVVRQLSQRFDLKPAQWAALRWLAEEGAGDRTASGFAAHHRVSLGAAAQTLGALDKRGFITRVQDPGDGRRRLLALTAEGQRLASLDPLRVLATAIGAQPAERLWITVQTLTAILQAVEQSSEPARAIAGGQAVLGNVRWRSHELREELTTIMGLSELLALNERASADTTRVREYSEAIVQSGRNVLALFEGGQVSPAA